MVPFLIFQSHPLQFHHPLLRITITLLRMPCKRTPLSVFTRKTKPQSRRRQDSAHQNDESANPGKLYAGYIGSILDAFVIIEVRRFLLSMLCPRSDVPPGDHPRPRATNRQETFCPREGGHGSQRWHCYLGRNRGPVPSMDRPSSEFSGPLDKKRSPD